MITYVNSKDAKLFELAAEALGETSLDLDQYLNRLADLKEISPRYVRLPLYEEGHEDEEIFDIDANARIIKVPASFNKNGVGVVSDELAETIWFKINRYFDIKDFGKAAGVVGDELKDGNLHILIQWEAPDGAKGASWAYAIDKDTDPEYIYFGWALTAEHLTAKAGNIKFAIRIMQYDADGIAYSFATQAASIVVKAGLSFDLTDEGIEIESVADKIANRLMGGQIAYCPVFAENGNLPAYVLNLEVPEGAEEGAPAQAQLEVIATAPEGDSYDAVAYKWYKKGANDEAFAELKGEYSPALTVTSSGEYYVVVFGMKEIVDNKEYIFADDAVSEEPVKFKYHTSVASSKSNVCTIPAPIKLKITKEMAEHLVLAESPVLVLEVERQMIEGEPVGIVSLKVEKTASAEKDLDLEHAEFLPVGEASEGSEAITEAWIWDGVEYASEEEAIAAKGEAEGEIEHREAKEAVPAVAGISYLVDGAVITIDMADAEEGYYRITVINKLNGDQEETVSTVICRVVKPAAINSVEIKLAAADGRAPQGDQGSIYRRDKLEAKVDLTGLLSDELLLQWYEVVSVKDPEEAEDAKDIAIEGATGTEYVPTRAGDYYFIAINKVEDSVIEQASDAIHFNA